MGARGLTALAAVLVMFLALAAGAPPVNGTEGSHAASRVRLDQLLQPVAKVGDGQEGGEGESPTTVALSASGDTALVGAPGDNGGAGSVFVFSRSGSTWVQQGPPLAGSGEIGRGSFGDNVALSGDGDVALVGGSSNGSSGEGRCCATGAVWVFTRSGSTWTQQGPALTAGRPRDSAEFGSGVALSASGREGSDRRLRLGPGRGCVDLYPDAFRLAAWGQSSRAVALAHTAGSGARSRSPPMAVPLSSAAVAAVVAAGHGCSRTSTRNGARARGSQARKKAGAWAPRSRSRATGMRR